MVFGDTGEFAVEAQLLEIYGKWTYGRLRLWLDGVPCGDDDDTSDLATSARWGRTFLGASPRRTRPDLDGLSSEEIYQLLHGRFVEPVAAASSKPWPGFWDREPYLLDEVFESALRDDYAVVVVRKGDGSDRVLLLRFEGPLLSEVSVPQGHVDRAIEEFCAWVEQLRSGPSPRGGLP